ncbi:MAG: aminotransferase class III-fold pyridoxal phosphate-dependent enzyme [Microbacteriaceae bacterium]|nr:aminotransferase class III-fold pyridoxal phosphate-dependent enzyme [Microbacteriaceae bacterium]
MNQLKAESEIDRTRLKNLWSAEVERFRQDRPKSGKAWQEASANMPDGVPMLWMAKWPGPWPVFVESALGSHFTDLDGIDHVDFCLGDTGAMAGHAPAASVAALSAQLSKGSTFMLPTEDGAVAAQLLEERFGLPSWQFTLSATDANRSAIRYARQVTGRPKIAVHDYCYHGTVDETFANLDGAGRVVSRRGNIGAPVALDQTTAVVKFNDLDDLEKVLSTGEIAAFLIEPALTNIGIVLPDPDYHRGVRELCTRYGTLLIIDETHTFCAGPGGMTKAENLEPDFLVIGKSIGGGVPAAAFGMTDGLARRIRESIELEDIDVGGVGGTLAGNALSLAGIRATLSKVLTPEAFGRMIERSVEWTAGVQSAIDDFGAPWQVTRLGARAEYSFRSTAPRDGAEAAAADDFELQQYLHLHALNRGILMTPFHNMALMCPETSPADVEAHSTAFRDAVADLFG